MRCLLSDQFQDKQAALGHMLHLGSCFGLSDSLGRPFSRQVRYVDELLPLLDPIPLSILKVIVSADSIRQVQQCRKFQHPLHLEIKSFGVQQTLQLIALGRIGQNRSQKIHIAAPWLWLSSKIIRAGVVRIHQLSIIVELICEYVVVVDKAVENRRTDLSSQCFDDPKVLAMIARKRCDPSIDQGREQKPCFLLTRQLF